MKGILKREAGTGRSTWLEQDSDYSKIAEARINNTKVQTEKQMKLWD